MGGYQEVSRNKISEGEKRMISSAEVVEGNYGKQVLFTLISGNTLSHTLGRDSVNAVKVGDKLDVDKLEIVRLSKAGQKEIDRIEVVD